MKKLFISALILASGIAQAAQVTVYQSKTCGCCHKWVDHLKHNGHEVKSVMLDEVESTKKKLGIPARLSSCHTAQIGGYLLEGHVPASAIEKLLKEKPKLKGLAVPGMPMGSPGMEGHFSERYDVIGFKADGSTVTYMKF